MNSVAPVLVALLGVGAPLFGQIEESVAGVRAMLLELDVRDPLDPDNSGCSKYNKEHYEYDTQGLRADLIRTYGGLWSPYTDECVELPWKASNPDSVEVEHIVARSEAHYSGMCLRSRRERKRFANDHLNLTLASKQVNTFNCSRGGPCKGSKDATGWPLKKHGYSNTCWFAAQVVKVKHAYDLSVDSREKEALLELLKNCETTGISTRTRFDCSRE